MMKTNLLNNLTRSVYKAGFKLKKHSPEILVGAGVVGVVTSAVMACKATTKLDEILEEPKEKIEKIHELIENPELVPAGKEYTEEDAKKDLTIMYTQSAVKVVKLYAPAVILGTISIAAILGGHNILRKRNFALAAAYTTIDKTFKDYRGRVVERFGKQIDKELRYNIKEKEIEETVVNEDGTESVVKKTVEVANIPNDSEYARFFDEYNDNWTKDPELNKTFLLQTQRFANDQLRRKGVVFLNEVYKWLGMSPSQAGQFVGWVYNEENPIGDNYIDFGIFDINNPAARLFVNGDERSILLDFNVDGPVYQYL